MPSPFGRLVPVLALLVAAMPIAAQAPEEPKKQEPPFGKPERIGTMPVKLLSESSGLVASRRHPGILWTHNDSGDAPVLFAVRMDGTIVRRVALPAAANVDWEDLALDEGNRLIVADTGDNFAARTEIVLYRLAEPDPAGTDAPGRVDTFRFRYPPKFGPVDAEALFVRGDRAFIVTKEQKAARLLRLPLLGDGQAATAPATAESIGSLEGLRVITAACLAADGRHLALLTYSKVVVLDFDEPLRADMPGPELLATLQKARRREQGFFLGQSEGITFDGASLVVSTETGPLASRPSLWRLHPK